MIARTYTKYLTDSFLFCLHSFGKMTSLKKLIISPPFGNYLDFEFTSSVFGTYTLLKRKGLLKQIIKSVRPVKGGGWYNKIGFRNSGIMNSRNPGHEKHIISVTAFSLDEWYQLSEIIAMLQEEKKYIFGWVELNISCPNMYTRPVTSNIVKNFSKWKTVIKLPPDMKILKQIGSYLEWGCNNFHMSNTLPSSKGGISGAQLQPHSLKLIGECSVCIEQRKL